jgi:uncharacterized lipoprotein YmbA
MTHVMKTIGSEADHAVRHVAGLRCAVRLSTLLPTLMLALLAVGCASKPTTYYSLAQAPLPLQAAASISASAPALSFAAPMLIELSPVIVPERLARQQMVLTKKGSMSVEVELLERHRWISTFDNELREALGTGIAANVGAIDVTRSGAPSLLPVWRIAVQLRQFDAIENVRVDAAFGWSARRSDGGESALCRWSGSAAVGNGINALAKGTQQVTEQAAQAIARHVKALALDPAAPCAL